MRTSASRPARPHLPRPGRRGRRRAPALTGSRGYPRTPPKVARADATRKRPPRSSPSTPPPVPPPPLHAIGGAHHRPRPLRDLLNRAATTVGDVGTAGSDLDEPSAESPVGPEVTKSRRTSPPPSRTSRRRGQPRASRPRRRSRPPPASSSPSPSPSATAPPASVARVKQAEQQFTSAQEGITERHPWPRRPSSSTLRRWPSRWPGSAVRRRECLDDAQQDQASRRGVDTEALQSCSPRPGTTTAESTASTARRPSTRSRPAGPTASRRPAPSTRPPTRRCCPSWRPRRARPPRRRRVDGGAPADPQARRLLDRSGRRQVDRRAHRRAQGPQKDLGVEPPGPGRLATIAAFEQALAMAQATPSSPPPSPPPPSPPPPPEPVLPTQTPSSSSSTALRVARAPRPCR